MVSIGIRTARLAVLFGVLAGEAWAAQVSGIGAEYSYGQTFLTWTRPAGTGWTYRVYHATTPPPPGAGVSHYTFLGTAKDSSGFNTRFFAVHDTLHSYTLPSGDTLSWSQGLYVHTPLASSSAYYAVTCESSGSPEDTALVAGVNALQDPIVEWPDRIRPVFQRSVTVVYGQFFIWANVYTLWTSDQDNGFAPAMCNRPSEPYDCAVSVNAGTSPNPGLMFHAHSRAGHYFNLNWGTMTPGEYVITIDDYLRTPQRNTYWFGYVDSYDISGTNSIPVQGAIEDYTLKRTAYTLDWARHAFPIDTSRVYVMGGSMGGIGCVRLATEYPEMIAGVMALVPLFDMGYINDPNPQNGFDVLGPERENCNYLFGTVATNLSMADGTPLWDRMDAKVAIAERAGDYVSPIIAFNGRNDTTVGWAEKTLYYAATQTHRAGGCYFFDTRRHHTPGQWSPLMVFAYLYRFRSNLSFPAFSNCSTDEDPGNGLIANGDSVGTLNGFMDWEPELTDTPSQWSATIRLRDLNGLFAAVPAPETLRVDVTPRRVQSFILAPFEPVDFTVVRSSDQSILQQGVVPADLHGIVTIPNVLVYKTGSRLTLTRAVSTGVISTLPSGLRLEGLPNPLRSRSEFSVAWPRTGNGRVELFDPSGRRVQTLFEGPVDATTARMTLEPRGVRPGLYFLKATDGAHSIVRRIAILAH